MLVLGIIAIVQRLLAGEKGVDWGVQLVTTLEEIKFHDEDVTEKACAELLDERASGRSRTT